MSTIKSTVSGTIIKIHAAPGDTLSSGDPVITVESMKMEIPVEAEEGCVVKKILVSEGDTIEEDDDVAFIT